MMRNPLVREVGFWLAIKAAALAALFFVFFAPAHRPEITPDAVERAFMASPDAKGETDR